MIARAFTQIVRGMEIVKRAKSIIRVVGVVQPVGNEDNSFLLMKYFYPSPIIVRGVRQEFRR